MKRVIAGMSYDTATAIKVALHRKGENSDRQITHYRTSEGKDFYHIQNHVDSVGHLQTLFHKVPDDYWHETYCPIGEVDEGAARSKARKGDRRIRPRQDTKPMWRS